VQEALTNIARHSGSPTARIRLAPERRAGRPEVVLTIEDTGKGMPDMRGIGGLTGRSRFPAAAVGVGLASMRERLLQVDGQLGIESRAGYTCLTATVPIKQRLPD
jgi:signal transduction histidine kinase